jgi:hypothetical protein
VQIVESQSNPYSRLLRREISGCDYPAYLVVVGGFGVLSSMIILNTTESVNQF